MHGLKGGPTENDCRKAEGKVGSTNALVRVWFPFGRDTSGDVVACDGPRFGRGARCEPLEGKRDARRASRGYGSVEMDPPAPESDRKGRWSAWRTTISRRRRALRVCLLHPEIALAHADLLIGAAEAGASTSDLGRSRADARDGIARLGRLKTEARAYERVSKRFRTSCRTS